MVEYIHSDLLQFDTEVLQHKTPELLKKIFGQAPISPEEQVIVYIRSFTLDVSFSKIENN